jgi:hypothetical protein
MCDCGGGATLRTRAAAPVMRWCTLSLSRDANCSRSSVRYVFPSLQRISLFFSYLLCTMLSERGAAKGSRLENVVCACKDWRCPPPCVCRSCVIRFLTNLSTIPSPFAPFPPTPHCIRLRCAFVSSAVLHVYHNNDISTFQSTVVCVSCSIRSYPCCGLFSLVEIR